MEISREENELSIPHFSVSGAQLSRMLKNGQWIVRKTVAIEKEQHIQSQFDWLKSFEGRKGIPRVYSCEKNECFFHYEMNYIAEAVSFNQLIESISLDEIEFAFESLWKILESSIYTSSDLSSNWDSFVSYWHFKLEQNFSSIENQQHKRFFEAEKVKINGKVYDGLSALAGPLKKLGTEISPAEWGQNVHGDLTGENVLANVKGLYLIDPNPCRAFLHPVVDFAKLLQTFYCDYENKKLKTFSVGPNSIDYKRQLTSNYERASEVILKQALEKYGLDPRAVMLHLLVHLARAVPYVSKKGLKSVYWLYAEMVLLSHQILNNDF